MARTKTTKTVTLPDGREESKTSVRDFTHAVARMTDRGWQVIAWTTQPQKAAKQCLRETPVDAQYKDFTWGAEIRVLPVN